MSKAPFLKLQRSKEVIRGKRKAKKGLVYLLRNNEGIYKYGCSTNLKERIRKIGYSNPFNTKFKLVKSVASKDIYKSENLFKWFLCSNQSASLSEYFKTYLSESDLIQKLEEFANAT